MQHLDLTIVVISFNTRDMTLECIRSVFRETHRHEFEVIVLDNASTDGSAEAIMAGFGEQVRLIASEENLGFAAGNNLAAIQSKGDYLLLLNPDTVVLDGAIDRLMEFSLSNPKAGIWGGKTVFGDGSLNLASCWSKQTVWGLFCQAVGLTSLFKRSSIFNPEGIGGWDRSGVRQVDIVSGCFLLIKKHSWVDPGGFREEFFMYGEEADLCLRASLLGIKPMVTSDATIIHYGGASEKIRADKMVRLLRAKNLLIWFHFPYWTKWLGSRLFYLWPVSRYAVHLMLSVTGRSSSRETAAIWGDVLRRKADWYSLPGIGKIS